MMMKMTTIKVVVMVAASERMVWMLACEGYLCSIRHDDYYSTRESGIEVCQNHERRHLTDYGLVTICYGSVSPLCSENGIVDGMVAVWRANGHGLSTSFRSSGSKDFVPSSFRGRTRKLQNGGQRFLIRYDLQTSRPFPELQNEKTL